MSPFTRYNYSNRELGTPVVLTIKIFREIMFDFKRIVHQTKPIRDPRNVTWFEFSFQKYVIYPGPGGSAKYGKAEEIF